MILKRNVKLSDLVVDTNSTIIDTSMWKATTWIIDEPAYNDELNVALLPS